MMRMPVLLHREFDKILTGCRPPGIHEFELDKDAKLECVTGVDAHYIVVEMVKHLLGPDWMKQYVEKTNHGGIECVLP